jgi:hypothetical protein
MMRRHKFLFVVGLLLVSVAGGYVWAAPASQLGEFGNFVFDIRADLEVLANEALGPEQRPTGWTFNTNVNSTTFISDAWFDNELLADAIFGPGVRPGGWFGITANVANLIARNTRHDLEMSASEVYGGIARPPEWRGAAPILRCERTLQNVISLLSLLYRVEPRTPESALNYCLAVAAEAEESLVSIALAQIEDLPDQILAVRGDLERLADERLGLNIRPPGWIGNRDRDSVSLAGDNFLDLELLANQLLGSNVRPPGWIGVISSAPAISYRNLRHDLELLADVALGPGERPRGWQGIDPLERCDPLVQSLVILVGQFGFSTVELPQGDYCQRVAQTANFLAENPPLDEVVIEDPSDRRIAQADWAFAYLDVGARQYMGIMPAGTRFRAWYRNYGESSMMFVSGDDFALYVDQRWTTLPVEIFDGLPTLEGVAPLTFCDARWCDGPGPTPTPTGAGPLILLLEETTPQAPPSQEEVAEKTRVSWNNIRVTYISDNTAARTAQVALEICAETQQINCEPVLRIFDTAAGAPRPVLGQTPAGLSIYEFSYGYTSNLIIEGATLTSPDVWISDPTIR